VGTKAFIESLPQKDQRVVEVPKEQRLVNRPSLRDVFATDRCIETVHRAYQDHGIVERRSFYKNRGFTLVATCRDDTHFELHLEEIKT
jgi:hypothetical protein